MASYPSTVLLLARAHSTAPGLAAMIPGATAESAVPASVQEISASSATALEHLNSITSLDSPLSTNPQEDVESRLDNVDVKLQDFDKEQRLILCFDVTQRHYTNYRQEYLKQARSSSRQLSMREDEAMRLMFHGSLVACYNNLKEKDVDKYSTNDLGEEDEHRILMRHKNTPTRFSVKQMKLLEKIISSTQDASTPGFLTIGGWMGQFYMVAVVLVLSSILYFGYRKLVTMQDARGKKGKISKADRSSKLVKKTK